MTTTRTVTKPQEILLGAFKYPIIGEVQSGLVSNDALKIVTSDQNRDSHARLSVQSWGNWTQGTGIDKWDGIEPRGKDHAWDSDLQLHISDGHLVLPGLATLTSAGAASDIGIISELSNVIYASFGTDLRSYSDTTNVWTNVDTLPADATDEVHDARLEDTTYMAIAHGTGWSYSSGSFPMTDRTKDAQFLLLHDERLWGIDATGQLWWVFAPGETETDDAQLPLGNNEVTNMFLGYDSGNNAVIYVSTTRGLFIHDVGNRRFEHRISLPFHPDNGKGSDSWEDFMYFSAGLAIRQYNGISGQVSQVGLDRNDGMPSDRRGTIRQLVPSHNELLAIIDATTIASAGDLFMSSQQSPGTSNSFALDPDTGFSHIMGWDTNGWERKWLSTESTSAITWLHVSDSYNQYRMWWAQNQRIYHMQIPQNIINPVYVTDLPYALSGNHETPDFTGGQSEVDKLAVRLRVELSGMSSTETVVLSFALNGSSTFTIMDSVYSTSAATTTGKVTTNGIATYTFDDVTTPAGTPFRSIRFKIAEARGSNTTLTPDVLRVDFEWRKKLPALWGHQCTVDLSSSYDGKSKEQMFENLRATAEQNAMSRFTFRDRDSDDAGNTNPYVYYVDVIGLQALENTGSEFASKFQLTLAEL